MDINKENMEKDKILNLGNVGTLVYIKNRENRGNFQ